MVRGSPLGCGDAGAAVSAAPRACPFTAGGIEPHRTPFRMWGRHGMPGNTSMVLCTDQYAREQWVQEMVEGHQGK